MDAEGRKEDNGNSDSGYQDNSSESGGSRIVLKKELSLLNGVAIIVGGIIGSGIFVSPKGVLIESGSVGLSLIVWTLCGFIAAIGATCYAELGSSILESGADYAYLRKAYGNLPGFLFLWVMLVCVFPAANAAIALVFANYILKPLFPDCDVPEVPITLLAAVAIIFLTAVNCWNVRLAAKVQDIFTITKLLALVIIIITGIVRLCMGHTHNLNADVVFEGSSTKVGAIALAFYSGWFSYSGWTYLNFLTEELKEPHKNLPRAIWISMPLVTIVYILANVSYFAVLTPLEMLDSSAVAVTFSDKTLGVMSWIMPVFVACSTFGALNGGVLCSSRLFFVGARHGNLPGALAMINTKYFTPVPSLIFSGITSLIMLCTSDVYALINYATFMEALFISLSVSGLLYLRWKEPDLVRPIKVSLFFPICFLLVCFFLLVMPFTYSPTESLMGIIIALAGIPVYLLGVTWQKKPKSFTKAVNAITVRMQKALYCVREEFKED